MAEESETAEVVETPDVIIARRLKALGKGKAIAGENGDRQFDQNGQSYRVRVMIIDEVGPNAPISGTPDVAPAIVGLSISVALMAGDEVAKDDQGRLVIFPATSLTIQPGAMAQPEFDISTEILKVIAIQIDSAEGQLAGRAAMPAEFDKWGARRLLDARAAEAAAMVRVAAIAAEADALPASEPIVLAGLPAPDGQGS